MKNHLHMVCTTVERINLANGGQIGSEKSSSILWVHIGGKDCCCVAKVSFFIIVKSSLSNILLMPGKLPTNRDS